MDVSYTCFLPCPSWSKSFELENLKPAEEENNAYVNLNPEKAQLSQTSVISKETWVAVGITLDEKEMPH